MIAKRIRHWKVVILILLLCAVNAWLIQRFSVSAAGETLTIDAPVVFSAGYTISSAQFIDSANSTYFLDPAATGNSLVTAGDATVSGNIALGNTKTIRSAFGPLSLQYKSGLDAWTTGLTLQDTTGNVGIGTTGPNVRLEVAGQSATGMTPGTAKGSFGILNEAKLYGLYTAVSGTGDVLMQVQRNDANTAVYNLLLQPSGGNVGIGTTTPSTALQVVGTITGTTKNFEIDHPTKPGMKLIHSTVEGPEVAVFYRGETRLVNGKAVVTLPEYFEALTRKEGRTVQLTAKNSWSPLYVDGEATNGRFTVKADSGNGSQQFFWEVKAVRKDVAPLQVEKSVN